MVQDLSKLAQLNLRSLQGIPVQLRLLEDKISGMGSGQFFTTRMSRLMERYQDLADAGGWWGTAGIDPFNNWQASKWGCFKGDQPRVIEGDIVKYEHPLGPERQFYLANLPDELAAKILEHHGIKFKEGDRFWQIVHQHNLPITYIEGYKKTLAALSQGEIAIGVSGGNALYLANEKFKGQKFKLSERQLTQPAKFWATPGREIKFAFDKDTKLKSILNVRRDLVRAIELHTGNHCTVAHWDSSQGKGVDDLIVQSGPRAFMKAMSRAIPAEREIKAHYRYQYNRLKKQGLTDSQIWLKACRNNDIKDGDRYISQSDFVRANPEQADPYLKQVKDDAIQELQRSQVSTKAVKRR